MYLIWYMYHHTEYREGYVETLEQAKAYVKEREFIEDDDGYKHDGAGRYYGWTKLIKL